jgi:hypothetical protein
VTFDSEEAAEQALSLDNTSILSRQIKVRRHSLKPWKATL